MSAPKAIFMAKVSLKYNADSTLTKTLPGVLTLQSKSHIGTFYIFSHKSWDQKVFVITRNIQSGVSKLLSCSACDIFQVPSGLQTWAERRSFVWGPCSASAAHELRAAWKQPATAHTNKEITLVKLSSAIDCFSHILI